MPPTLVLCLRGSCLPRSFGTRTRFHFEARRVVTTFRAFCRLWRRIELLPVMKPMSKLNVEQVKRESAGLRGPLATDLASSDAFLSEAGKVLIKFHGSYEQSDRDRRSAREYAFMVRSKLPGGQLSAAQYLAHDAIAATHGNGTLRVTTRQGIQFHGVIKGELRETIRAINHSMATTFGACGDVVRNVMCCPAHAGDAERDRIQRLALELSRATLPRTRAYHQIWLDGEPLVDDGDEAEPLYGETYLPRKFKTGIALAG